MDALTDVLKALRLRSETYFCSDFASPWGMQISHSGNAQFHVVVEGACYVFLEGPGQLLELKAGDIIAFPTGANHWISDQKQAPTLSGSELLSAIMSDNNPFAPKPEQALQTTLLCGAFDYDQSIKHPLLRALPCYILIRAGSKAQPSWLAPTLLALADETRSAAPGASVVVDRLSEVLFVALLRAYIAENQTQSSYLQALSDHKIGPALTLIHQDDGAQLSIESLADQVALSRGAFSKRFSTLVGMSPKHYLTNWRLNRAKAWLQAGNLSMYDIAQHSGYASEAAFSKAFKLAFGISPGQARKHL